ncbi:MAG TPA: RIP metalloprotease RseP [Flavobacteriales bacterium]|nr:RIP metalloprotease RseP [Flavobacteriales bacterium]
MEIFIKAAQLILSLSILIVLHEMGHFVPAKLFKTRVEKFYLFFNPWFSLFKVKRGETEYGLGWLPLGGYVKISGMVDESMDKEQMNQPPQPWEFRSKPAWQRLIIMIGGVTVNVILGFLIYMMVVFVWGKDNIHPKNAKYGIVCDSVLMKHGLHNGDMLISVDGEVPEDLMTVNKMILLHGKRDIKVKRDGKDITVKLPQDIDYKMVAAGAKTALAPRVPTVVDSVIENSPAAKAGLTKGDSITRINGMDAGMYDLFTANMHELASHQIAHALEKEYAGIQLEYVRNGEEKSVVVKTDKDGRVGFFNQDLDDALIVDHVSYGFFASIPKGLSLGGETLKNYVISLKFLFTKAGAKQIGGFGAIGGLFSPTWDWHSFWMLTAFLSMVLAFMNMLPIPALDGGHVMFLVWEMITGRAPHQKVLEYAQMVGMVLLLGLLLYANGNDIMKLFS